MPDDFRFVADRLLDEQLDQLDPGERARLKQTLASDPALAAQHRRLQRALEPLDTWTASQPPAGMVGRILDRIAAADRNTPLSPVFRLPESAVSTGSVGGRIRVALHDIVAVAAVLAFFFGMLAPSASMVRERSRQAQCASNLAGIGRAVSAYALANNNALPFERMQGAATSFLPVRFEGAAGAVYSPNSHSVMILARQGFVPNLRIFICPSQRQVVPLNDAELKSVGDQSPSQFCSYDSINMAGPTPDCRVTFSIPYMADSNPLFAGGQFNAAESVSANSRNHGRAGQNVLHLDSSVRWTVTPNAGRRGDNIWQAGRIETYRGTEVQQSKDDTFLVP